MAAGRFAAGATLLVSVTLVSCIFDDLAWHRSVTFELLALPSHVAEGDSALVDVAFLTGRRSSWNLESLDVLVQGHVVQIVGRR